MNVPFIDLAPSHRAVDAKIRAALGEIMERCDFVLGKSVRDFEEAMRERLGVNHTLALNSGTDALILALRALGIGPGDAVIVPPFTFFATSETVNLVGAEPLFCDIEPAGYCLSPDAVERRLEEGCSRDADGRTIDVNTGRQVKAVIPVHLFGQCADMPRFVALAKKWGLFLIEDAAQALGARAALADGDGLASAMGDAGCLSFYPSKNLGAYGDAGMLTCNDPAIYGEAKKLHVHGSDRRYFHDAIGYNSRMDSFQAAILSIRLHLLDEWIEERRKLARRYFSRFREKLQGSAFRVVGSLELPGDGKREDDTLVLPDELHGRFHTYNSFNIRVPRRDEMSRRLTERGIGNMIYYPLILPLQKVYEGLKFGRDDFPAAANVSDDILCLPLYPGLTDGQADHVADVIAAFLTGADE